MRFALVLLSFIFCSAVSAQNFSADQKKEIETVIHNYLISNPEVLKESFAALEKKEADAQVASRLAAVNENKELLFNSKNQAVIGNPSGDVTLVEFFDYNCGYCRSSQAELKQLIADDKNLRVVLKEFPVLGSGSIEAALVAAQLIGTPAYEKFHNALLASESPVDKESAIEAAKSLKLDSAKLEKGMQEPHVRDVLKESYTLANALGINGTPGYVIGTQVFVGAAGADKLKTAITNMRKCGKAEC